MEGSKRVIFAALGGNLAIAVSKVAAFAFTGSSAMLTEAVHSFVDTGNQGLLLLGIRRAKKPPDDTHPFGYGMEAYFWSFVVALTIFALGGAVSIWEGVEKILHPTPIAQPWINYLVLAAAVVFEGVTFLIAYREFGRVRRGAGLLVSIRRSKDPNLFAVLLEDAAALAGLGIALVGVTATVYLHLAWADGLASIAIGLLLVTVAIFLAAETRSLLTGEAAAPRIVDAIRDVLRADGRVERDPEVLTLHLGPEEILVGISLHICADIPREGMETALDEITAAVRAVDSRITRIFLRPARDGGPAT